MEVPLPMQEFLDKALRLKGCTNQPMPALHGRRDKPSMWILNVWRQMEAMCSPVVYLGPITQRISGRAGISVIHPATVRLVVASLPIRSETIRYSLATAQECSYQRTAARPGS